MGVRDEGNEAERMGDIHQQILPRIYKVTNLARLSCLLCVKLPALFHAFVGVHSRASEIREEEEKAYDASTRAGIEALRVFLCCLCACAPYLLRIRLR